MPFPLAHPAAILPLRRYCPRWLCLSALVIGSIVPDLAYLWPGEKLSDFSHSFVGGTGFGVVVGTAVFLISTGLVRVASRALPENFRADLGLGVAPGWLGLVSVAASLLIGTWTHLFLDSFTHSHGWFALHWEWLRMPVLVVRDRPVRVCHLLWYACSFAGLACLVWVTREWQQRRWAGRAVSRASLLCEAIMVSLLVLPIEVLHHFVRSFSGLVGIAGVSLLLSALVFARPLLRRQAPPVGL